MGKKRKRLEKRIKAIIPCLETKNLIRVAEYVELIKHSEEWEATLEIMNDPQMREDLEIGRAEADRGEGRLWREVKQELDQKCSKRG